MKRTLIALTAAVAMLAAAPVAAGAKDDLRVFFPGDCKRNAYKPKSIQVFCADGGMLIQKITYRSYGAKRATGAGTATVKICEPNCAEGSTERHDVRLTLSRVRQCGDVPQFTRLRVTFADAIPEGFRQHVTQRVGCAEAPR